MVPRLLPPDYVPLVLRKPATTHGLWGAEQGRKTPCRTALGWRTGMGSVDLIGRTSTASQNALRNTFDSVKTPPYHSRLYTTSPTTSQRSPVTSKVFLTRRKQASGIGTGVYLGNQRLLKDKLRVCYATYRRKLEAKFQENNVWEVWTGIKQITGFEAGGRWPWGFLERLNEKTVSLTG